MHCIHASFEIRSGPYDVFDVGFESSDLIQHSSAPL